MYIDIETNSVRERKTEIEGVSLEVLLKLK